MKKGFKHKKIKEVVKSWDVEIKAGSNHMRTFAFGFRLGQLVGVAKSRFGFTPTIVIEKNNGTSKK